MAKCTSQLFGLFKGPAIFILHNFSFLCNTVYLCLFMLNRGQFMYVYSQDLSNFTGTIFFWGGVAFVFCQLRCLQAYLCRKGSKGPCGKAFRVAQRYHKVVHDYLLNLKILMSSTFRRVKMCMRTGNTWLYLLLDGHLLNELAFLFDKVFVFSAVA